MSKQFVFQLHTHVTVYSGSSVRSATAVPWLKLVILRQTRRWGLLIGCTHTKSIKLFSSLGAGWALGKVSRAYMPY